MKHFIYPINKYRLMMEQYNRVPTGVGLQIVDAIDTRDEIIDKCNELLSTIQTKFSNLEKENQELKEKIKESDKISSNNCVEHEYHWPQTHQSNESKENNDSTLSGVESGDILILQFNMLANGLMDSFLNNNNMRAFINKPGDLEARKKAFEELNSNVKKIFIKSVEGNKITYNKDLLSVYELYLSGKKSIDTEIKRIKNISNNLWIKMQSSIMASKDDRYVPESRVDKDIDKINMLGEFSDKFTKLDVPDDLKRLDNTINEKKINEASKIVVIIIENAINELSKRFLEAYPTYKSEVKNFEDIEKSVSVDIENYLQLRFNIFKLMVMYSNPDIICLQEDDYENYFYKDDYFKTIYEFVHCEKFPSNAKDFTSKKRDSKFLRNLTDDYSKKSVGDGATVLYKRTKFVDNGGNDKIYNMWQEKKDESPHVVKKLTKIDTGEIFIIFSAHLESGSDSFAKEELRIKDLKLMLDNKVFKNNNELFSESKSSINLVMCMDGNTPFLDEQRFNDYYKGDFKEVEKDKFVEVNYEPSDNIKIDDKFIDKSSAMNYLMNQLHMTQNNVAIEHPTKMYSVNRFRGPDSAQLAKVFEYEYHCIDHVFYKGPGYKLEKTILPEMKENDYANLLPNINYDVLKEESEDDLKDLVKTSVDNLRKGDMSGVISISDHLPVFVVLKKIK